MERRPCIVLARPMNQADPVFARGRGRALFALALGQMLDQGLFTEAVFALPGDVPDALARRIAGWGFDLVRGAEAPQVRVLEAMDALGCASCAVLTPYACLVDRAGLDLARGLVASGADAAHSVGVMPAREFLVLTRRAAGALSGIDNGALPPGMFPARLRSLGLRVEPVSGLEAPAERFAWGTYFAGKNALIPPDILAAFYEQTEPAEWFERGSFGRMLGPVCGLSGLDEISEALERCGDDGGGTLASQVNFLRSIGPHMPQGGRFLEIGGSRVPLLAMLLMNRFKSGVSVEPIVYSEQGVRAASGLCRALSLHAPGLIPIDAARTARPGFEPEVRPCTVEELGLEEASVDFCCSKVVLEHVRDVDSLSRELFRVLGPGAVMVHRI
ncbi:MAG: methyltransferase domain-containing protein, partial [Desulfovibrionaceae bacterium]|nr:methyltransferase domain-containing protein [Desulfovibrionaceae bacterium]